MAQQIETRRLILRPWRESDAPALFQVAKDPRVGNAADWPPHTSVEQSREVIREVFSAPETYAVVLAQSGTPVGCCGLVPPQVRAYPPGEGEIGYWLGHDYWGRGIIPEAVSALVKHCFSELGYHTLHITCFAENRNSARVAEKCGFTHVSTSPVEGRQVSLFTLRSAASSTSSGLPADLR